MILYFQPQNLPRTMTREEWREAYRWVRITTKRLEKLHSEHLENLRAIIADDTASHKLRMQAVEKIINPPMMVYP